MRRFFGFVAIGSLFATVEEFLTVVVLRGEFGSYLFTVVILFPLCLSAAFGVSRLIDRLVSREPARDFVHFVTCGLAGLIGVEWGLIGLTPWSNPNAPPILMILFQAGMFLFWATISTVPRVFLAPGARAHATRRRILRFFIAYFAIVYVVAFAVPAAHRFATLIPLIVAGYVVVAGQLLRPMFGSPGPAELA